MNRSLRSLFLGATAALAFGLLGACGDDSSASSGGSPSLSITSPSDGATVSSDVEVSWDSSEQLGEPDSGRDHVHVFVDGDSNDYTVVGGNSFTVEGLTPGEHTLNVTLQHADHSSAGAEDEVDVMVSGSGETPTTPDATESTGPDYGY